MTPLALAIRGAWPEFAHVIDKLLEKGANVNARDVAGWTPLMEAAATGDVRTAELLVARGAHVNDAANDGQTPIYLAARGRPKMVEYLLAHGADPNATTRDGRTPLMHAVKTGWLTVVKPALIDGYREVFEALLARGADVNRRDSSGTTALMEAAANGDAETVELLLSHGADPTLRDARGKSAFDIAAKATHGAVVRALVAHDVPLGAKQRIKYALGRLAYALSWIFTPFFILAISVLVAYSRRRIKKPRAPRRTVLSGSDLPPLAKIDCAECGACVPLKLEGMRCPHCKTPTRPPEDYVATLKARAKGAALLVEALAAWRRATLFSSTPVRVFFWAIGFVWLAVIVAGALSDVGRSLFDGHPLLFISALVSAAGLPVFSVSYASYLGDVRKRLPIIPTIGAEVASAAVVDCRSCGAPVEFDAGQLVTSCGYCGGETYRVALARRARQVAEKERTEASLSLYRAMREVAERRDRLLDELAVAPFVLPVLLYLAPIATIVVIALLIALGSC